MARRIACIGCLLLALASAAMLARSYRVIDAAAYDSLGLDLSVIARHGSLKVVVRTTDGFAWSGGEWGYARLTPSPPPSSDLYGAGTMGAMKIPVGPRAPDCSDARVRPVVAVALATATKAGCAWL